MCKIIYQTQILTWEQPWEEWLIGDHAYKRHYNFLESVHLHFSSIVFIDFEKYCKSIEGISGDILGLGWTGMIFNQNLIEYESKILGRKFIILTLK